MDRETKSGAPAERCAVLSYKATRDDNTVQRMYSIIELKLQKRTLLLLPVHARTLRITDVATYVATCWEGRRVKPIGGAAAAQY